MGICLHASVPDAFSTAKMVGPLCDGISIVDAPVCFYYLTGFTFQELANMQQNPYLVLVWFFVVFFSSVVSVNVIALIWSSILDRRIRRIARRLTRVGGRP